MDEGEADMFGTQRGRHWRPQCRHIENCMFGEANMGIQSGGHFRAYREGLVCVCGEHNTSTQRGASLKTKIWAYGGGSLWILYFMHVERGM